MRRFQQSVTWVGIAIILASIAVDLRGDPQWWSTRGVTNGQPSADNSVALLGQGKYVVQKAYEEMASGGLVYPNDGTVISSAVESGWFTDRSNDNNVLQIGQLKFLGSLVFNRLNELGMGVPKPWTDVQSDDNDFGPALLGQVKTVFDVELLQYQDTNSNGINDFVEDLDHDGVVRAKEEEQGTLDSLADTDGDTWWDGMDADPRIGQGFKITWQRRHLFPRYMAVPMETTKIPMKVNEYEEVLYSDGIYKWDAFPGELEESELPAQTLIKDVVTGTPPMSWQISMTAQSITNKGFDGITLVGEVIYSGDNHDAVDQAIPPEGDREGYYKSAIETVGFKKDILGSFTLYWDHANDKPQWRSLLGVSGSNILMIDSDFALYKNGGLISAPSRVVEPNAVIIDNGDLGFRVSNVSSGNGPYFKASSGVVEVVESNNFSDMVNDVGDIGDPGNLKKFVLGTFKSWIKESGTFWPLIDYQGAGFSEDGFICDNYFLRNGIETRALESLIARTPDTVWMAVMGKAMSKSLTIAAIGNRYENNVLGSEESIVMIPGRFEAAPLQGFDLTEDPAWLAVDEGGTKEIKYIVANFPSKFYFEIRNLDGVATVQVGQSILSGSEWDRTLTISGVQPGRSELIVKNTYDEGTVATLNIDVRPDQATRELQIWIVRLPGQPAPPAASQANLTAYLNDVFAQVNVNFSITGYSSVVSNYDVGTVDGKLNLTVGLGTEESALYSSHFNLAADYNIYIVDQIVEAGISTIASTKANTTVVSTNPTHEGSQEYIIAHEVGHLLGIIAANEGHNNTHRDNLMRTGAHEHEPREIRRRDWDQIKLLP